MRQKKPKSEGTLQRQKTFEAQQWIGYSCALLLGAIIAFSAVLLFDMRFGPSEPKATPGSTRRPPKESPLTLHKLLNLPSSELGRYDAAEMSMLCSQGFGPESDELITKTQSMLAEWTRELRLRMDQAATTARLQGKMPSPEYRMQAVVSFLREKLGPTWTEAIHKPIRYTNANQLFLSGLAAKEQTLSQISLSTLVAAMGQRMSLPVGIAQAKNHVYVRWEDTNGTSLNIECTPQGMKVFPDKHYHSWPQPMTPMDLASQRYLRMLSPAETLAAFLTARGHCMLDRGMVREAQVAYAQAHRIAPADPTYLAWLSEAVGRETGQSKLDPQSPMEDQASAMQRQGSNKDNPDPFAEIRRIEAINAANRQRRMGNNPAIPGPVLPQRPGGAPLNPRTRQR